MKQTATPLVVGIALCFVAVVTASTVVYVVDSATAAAFVTPLLTAFATTATLIAGLTVIGNKQADTDRKVEEVAAGVTYLANGGMDSKVRAGVADILPDHLIDPDAVDLIERDRAKRLAHHTTAPEELPELLEAVDDSVDIDPLNLFGDRR